MSTPIDDFRYIQGEFYTTGNARSHYIQNLRANNGRGFEGDDLRGSAPDIQWSERRGHLGRWIAKLINLDTATPRDSVLEVMAAKIFYQSAPRIGITEVDYEECSLSSCAITPEVKAYFNVQDDIHTAVMVKMIPGYHDLGADFIDQLRDPHRTLPCSTEDPDHPGQRIPIRGLGRLLAQAKWLGDIDVFGGSGKNIGFVVSVDPVTGQRYARLQKIDPGYAFQGFGDRYMQTEDISISSFYAAGTLLKFSDLLPEEQQEFLDTVIAISRISPASLRRMTQLPLSGTPPGVSHTIQTANEMSFNQLSRQQRKLVHCYRAALQAHAPHWLARYEMIYAPAAPAPAPIAPVAAAPAPAAAAPVHPVAPRGLLRAHAPLLRRLATFGLAPPDTPGLSSSARISHLARHARMGLLPSPMPHPLDYIGGAPV